MMRIRRIGIPSAGLAILLTSLFIQTASAAPTGATTKTNPAVYNFTGTTVQGKSFSGRSLIGKPTVMWFWAPWCTICRSESPDLVALSKRFMGKINMVGVAGLGPVRDMKGFIKDTHTNIFLHLADESGTIWNRFKIVSQPSFIFISKSGVAYRLVGSLAKNDLFSITSDLIKKA
jgi:thiol-disulfide isomerase/thioredoxin